MLESLPPEVLQLVLNHLPRHQYGPRPRSALLPLLSTSRTLRLAALPILNATIELHSIEQAQRFLNSDSNGRSVTSLIFHKLDLTNNKKPTSNINTVAVATRPRWPPHLLAALLFCPERESLKQLHLATEVDSVLEILQSLLLPLSTESPFYNRPLVRIGASLTNLSLELEDPTSQAHVPSNPPSGPSSWDSGINAASESLLIDVRDGLDYPVRSPSTTLRSFVGAEASQKSSMPISILDLCHIAFPSLEQLSLRGSCLPESGASPALPAPPSKICRLELRDVTLSDQALFTCLAHVRDSIRDLSLVGCHGFTAAGLVHAVSHVGQDLRVLRLSLDLVTSKAPSSPPSSGTPPSTPPRADSPSPSTPPPPKSSLSPFVACIDQILPFTPALDTLAWSGPLSSPSLPNFLHKATPFLRSLHISNHASLPTPALLPLVSPASPSHLPRLRRLCLNTAPSANEGREFQAEAEVRELWCAASNSGLESIEGTAFEGVVRNLGWAEEISRASQSLASTDEAPRKRKRPSMAKR
ncbi:hypothetical protein T439DRAFT_320467 [Meredithblackwellia eburnea MCA 4105]